MILAIIGSRGFKDKELLDSILTPRKDLIKKVISGGANGADKLGEQWAIENKIETEIFYPDWNKYGKKAGFIRNEDIIKNSTHVIAFWDGESKGTKHSIGLSKKLEKKLKIVLFKKPDTGATEEVLGSYGV
jgi:hypothetical protein